MSTPTSLDLPDGVRRTTIHTARGAFAALEAAPVSGVCEREAALLVPGYTGSKEDFLAIFARDRTAELARLDQIPMLVIYGENDNSWSPAAQENMARRLGAHRLCIPAAVHSPAVEAPATTASALTQFWDAAEAGSQSADRPSQGRRAEAAAAPSGQCRR